MNQAFALPIATLALGAAIASHAASRTDLLGSMVPASEAKRTVQITPKTKYVNVTKDDTVAFSSNGQTFAIRFDGVRPSFDMAKLAPAGALDHKVKVYVGPNPTTTAPN